MLDKVTDFLLFLGKVLIAGSVGECQSVVVFIGTPPASHGHSLHEQSLI